MWHPNQEQSKMDAKSEKLKAEQAFHEHLVNTELRVAGWEIYRVKYFKVLGILLVKKETMICQASHTHKFRSAVINFQPSSSKLKVC